MWRVGCGLGVIMKRGVVIDIGRIVWLNTLGATGLGQFKTCFASPHNAKRRGESPTRTRTKFRRQQGLEACKSSNNSTFKSYEYV
jgi:hypothetical protein